MKVVVAMSGGVDSAVTAWLLKKRGYEVVGVHFKTELDDFFLKYELTHKVCCSPDDTNDAKRVAKRLGIELHVLDIHQQFERDVVRDFIKGYQLGLTPNPCVRCNRKIKFFYLRKFSQHIGASFWATGHYARIKDGKISIAKDEKKDQSYFLALVRREDLKGLLLPIGDYRKKEVRILAKENDLGVSTKPDSQDVCFIPDGDMKSFFEKTNALPREGLIVDTKGKVLGKHEGYQLYTIGQRKGLNLAVGERVYVVDILADKNLVIVGKKEELYTKSVKIGQVNLQEDLPEEIECECKVRSTAQRVPCHVRFKNKKGIVNFSREVLAVPGQLLAFYQGKYLLGGGIMLKSRK